jgi:hypothetical protein
LSNVEVTTIVLETANAKADIQSRLRSLNRSGGPDQAAGIENTYETLGDPGRHGGITRGADLAYENEHRERQGSSERQVILPFARSLALPALLGSD